MGKKNIDWEKCNVDLKEKYASLSEDLTNRLKSEYGDGLETWGENNPHEVGLSIKLEEYPPRIEVHFIYQTERQKREYNNKMQKMVRTIAKFCEEEKLEGKRGILEWDMQRKRNKYNQGEGELFMLKPNYEDYLIK